MSREDRLGVKLDTPEGQFPVSKAHDFTFGRLGCDLEGRRKCLPLHDQAVVTGCLKGVWQP